MIHISRSVQPPNPNSAVPPPSPSDRQPPHAARNGGGSRISAHCRSRGGQCGNPPSDAVRKRSSRTVPRHRIGSPRAPYRDEAPDTDSPKTVPPRKRRGRTHGTSPRRAPRNGTLLKTRSPKNEFFPKRAPQDGRPRKTRFSQDERSGRGFPKTNSHPEPPSR